MERHAKTENQSAPAAGAPGGRVVGHAFATLCIVAGMVYFAVDQRPLFSLPGARKVPGEAIELPPDFPPVRRPSRAETPPPYLQDRPEVTMLPKGRQLFVDDYLIESTTLERECHQATLYPGNPVLAPDGPPDDRGIAMPFSDGVWYDPSEDRFKMWYYGGRRHTLSYAYSTDGKHWVRPSLPDAVFPGTNMVLDFGGGRDSVSVWLDYEDPNPERRYKAFSYAGSRRLRMYGSPDGLHWKSFGDYINSISDRTTVFWNPFRKVWVNSARGRTVLPPEEDSPKWYARARYYQESADLVTWQRTDPLETYWTGPDFGDIPYPGENGTMPELYNLDATPYESLMVGLFSWFYPEPGPDLVEIGLGFSRDGFHWTRPQRGGGADRAFIPAAGKSGAWDAYNTQSVGGGFLVVGDQLWFYFSGRDKPHSTLDWRGATGLATLRRDGFCSMDAESPGELTTRPLGFSGSYPFVNADTRGGELRLEALDSAGRPIPPFTLENSIPFRGDSTGARMRWKGEPDVSALQNRAVRFRFVLTGGSLFSFWLSESENGASGGYMAAGGPGLEGPIDTVGIGKAQ